MLLQRLLTPLLATTLLVSCGGDSANSKNSSDAAKGTYAYDVDFLKKHTRNVIELTDEKGESRILLSGDYQGRVMTSSASGDSGISFGWINYDLIASGERKRQFNPVGGEERFWLGPEGGQYSLYFNAGDSFKIANWQVPPVIDTVSYEVISSSKKMAMFSQRAVIKNYSGTEFELMIHRGIQLLDVSQLRQELGVDIPASVKSVGYATENRIINSGNADWKKENGLVSIWLLGMFTPTPQTVVIIPFEPGTDSRQKITDNYFGPVPPDRLQVQDSVLFFTCDGKFRSKIGIAPSIAKPMAASFDFKNNVLTIVIPVIDKSGSYVNSKWEIQQEPYKGDVINSYNDGPLADGSQLGPFYEIESSSPARELRKGEKLEYRQVTCHLQGDYETLRGMARQLLHVDLNQIKR